jgi:hypothetical protein
MAQVAEKAVPKPPAKYPFHLWAIAISAIIAAIEVWKFSAFAPKTDNVLAAAHVAGAVLPFLGLPLLAALLARYGFKRQFARWFFIGLVVIGLPLSGFSLLGTLYGKSSLRLDGIYRSNLANSEGAHMHIRFFDDGGFNIHRGKASLETYLIKMSSETGARGEWSKNDDGKISMSVHVYSLGSPCEGTPKRGELELFCKDSSQGTLHHRFTFFPDSLVAK